MPVKYDVDAIFRSLEEKWRIKQPTKDSIPSPKNAPKTEEVAPATSKTTEDKHGGDEVSKEIKDSPNSTNDIKNENNKKKMDTENERKGYRNGDRIGKKQEVAEDNKKKQKNLEIKGKQSEEEMLKQIEDFFKRKSIEQERLKKEHKEEYLRKYIFALIKKFAAEHAGIDRQTGSESYDKKQIVEHLFEHQDYKILTDKYDLKDARHVQFFIDTSGSNGIFNEIMPQIIDLLERQGYECYIAACGNGFYSRDMVEDKYFRTRETLEGYHSGIVNKIACPTPQTAARMANEAEFSVIVADFDGLSSICEMANLCQRDKVPYFLCSEDRYPWEDPTIHDWVTPDLCTYNPKLVYDVSLKGNPTLKQYYDRENYYDDDYEYYNSD